MDGSSFQATNTPPNRGDIATEQPHPRSAEFDRLSIQQRIALLAEDHRAVVESVERAKASLCDFINDLAERMRCGGRLIYIGAGTSGRLGVLDASECPPTFHADPSQVIGIIAGGDAALRQSSESKEDDPRGVVPEFDRLALGERDTVLGIAAGGTTPFVLGGIAEAASRGALTGMLTCAPQAAMPTNCDHLIVLDTGPEVLTGSTRLKAGSATKLALNIITTSVFAELGKIHGNLMVDLRATNDKLLDRAIRILQQYVPHLDRSQAARAIEQAGGLLKLAIVMQTRGLSRKSASALLEQHGHHLRSVLGEVASSPINASCR